MITEDISKLAEANNAATETIVAISHSLQLLAANVAELQRQVAELKANQFSVNNTNARN
jgi:hypothetical protein